MHDTRSKIHQIDLKLVNKFITKYIMKKILNAIHEDYHMHSINYSDGMNTIDEIVQYADKIWLKKLVITDHSQFIEDQKGFAIRNRRSHTMNRWKNVYNDVDVSFWVEWDMINDTWECCFDIQWIESDFSILSCHDEVYQWNLKNITQAYTNAIKRYHDKIKFIWHICFMLSSEYLDIPEISKVLNQYQIPIELNSYYLHVGKTDTKKLNQLLSLLETWVYVNSDMHTLKDFSYRQAGFDYLKSLWYK